MKNLTKKQKDLLLTKNGKLNKHIENSILNSLNIGNKFYPKSWSKNGRHHSLKDYSYYIFLVLKAFNFKCTLGNDAPKGGVEGDFIKISSRAKSVIFELLKNY